MVWKAAYFFLMAIRPGISFSAISFLPPEISQADVFTL
jgi:hypothetical protein